MELPYIDYILSVTVHVGCFCFLAIMNIAVIHWRTSFCVNTFSIILGMCLGVELLGHMVAA